MPLLINNKHVAYLLLSGFVILSTLYLMRENREASIQFARRSDDVKISSFYHTWCNVRKLRKDWKRILQPCKGIIKWGSTKEDWLEPTDPQTSIIVSMDIRPTYEFSRIFIETKTKDNKRKAVGGDSWRIHLRGPSSPSTTVFDHQNGTYEVVFLIIEPGIYTVHAYLEHSLCDGLKEPPDNWFVIGNAQGKYQRQGSLGSDQAYLSKKLNSVPTINILEQGSQEYQKAVHVLMENGNSICKDKCNYLWDGYGRWIGDKWHPYQNDQVEKDNEEVQTSIQPNHDGIFWFYGDSVMAQFYSNIKLYGKVCYLFTGRCGHSYNWVYKIIGYNTTRAKLENDEKDFNRTRILSEVKNVLQYQYFNKPQSTIFMNFGLHFTESTSFSNYMKLIQDLVSLVKNKDIYKGNVIWRTTTALNKHKLGGKHQHSRRFLTQHRVKLYNAYATSQMCTAGIPVFDLFSLTDSYPKGSGIAGYQFDAVHYEHKIFSTAEKRLERLLKDNII